MTVYLVGAGPGDPGLLTRRGAELLARADVVIYDRLIDRSLLELAPASAQLIDVGKRPAPAAGGGTARQSDINALLVEHGAHGRTVVRLKGGDPFLFGRGGEEAEALRESGIEWEVVPGVTSAVAVPAAAGVPVTHRGLSTSVTIVTGHVGDTTAPGAVDWDSLGRAGGTIVVLMGMATRAEIARRLMAAGRPGGTPVAVVEWGTTPSQRSARTTLEELGSVSMGSPAVIVIGPVAGLALSAVEASPLSGVTVVVTRLRGQSVELVSALRRAGARVLEVPAIEIADPLDGGAALAAAAARAREYDWIAFTSANAVHRFVSLLRDGRDLGSARLAAVGGGTAGALAEHFLVADVVPEEENAAALAWAIIRAGGSAGGGSGGAGRRVLFPRAEDARDTLLEVLGANGFVVDGVTAYRTIPAAGPPAEVADSLAEAASALPPLPTAVTFSSPSAVAAFLSMRDQSGRPVPLPAVVVCSGPVTAAAARAAGLEVVEAPSPSTQGLIEALCAGLIARVGS